MLSLPDFKQKQIAIALVSRGEKISFRNDNLLIKDAEGKVRHQSSCHRLFALFVVGQASLTSGILLKAKRFGFSIVMLSHGLKPYGSWMSGAEGNVLLRQKQYAYDETLIAQHIVKNKIAQQIEYLTKRRNKSDALHKTIDKLKTYRDKIIFDKAMGLDTLLGIEGSASRIYFKHMFDVVEWQGRRPRAKLDIVNLLLDIGYMQLFHLLDAMLSLYGFDPYKGVYHQAFYQRKSLVSDLVEPFRPMVDYQIRKMYTLGQIDTKDFVRVDRSYRLFKQQAQHYTTLMLKGLMENKVLLFEYVRQYYRAFIREKPAEMFPRIEKGEVIW